MSVCLCFEMAKLTHSDAHKCHRFIPTLTPFTGPDDTVSRKKQTKNKEGTSSLIKNNKMSKNKLNIEIIVHDYG